MTWGEASAGGDSSEVSLTDVQQVFATSKAFAALTNDGGVVTWGSAEHGGVMYIVDVPCDYFDDCYEHSYLDDYFGSEGADELVLREDVSAQLASDVVEIFANDHAFAALKADGSVVTWGDGEKGGEACPGLPCCLRSMYRASLRPPFCCGPRRRVLGALGPERTSQFSAILFRPGPIQRRGLPRRSCNPQRDRRSSVGW